MSGRKYVAPYVDYRDYRSSRAISRSQTNRRDAETGKPVWPLPAFSDVRGV